MTKYANGNETFQQDLTSHNNDFETVYLSEDEIEGFVEKYMLENPGCEVEERFINHPKIEMVQSIEVKWLRPVTPEIPPIIIKEINYHDDGEIKLKIIQKQESTVQQNNEPIVIREQPPVILVPESKVAYFQNVKKIDENCSDRTKPIISNDSKQSDFKPNKREILLSNNNKIDSNSIPKNNVVNCDRDRQVESNGLHFGDTSSYRKIKFKKVIDPKEITRLDHILNNPKSLTIREKTDTDGIAKRLARIAEQEKLD
jgi:hypothetical protein